jgi:hypothetical protein
MNSLKPMKFGRKRKMKMKLTGKNSHNLIDLKIMKKKVT